MKKRITIAMLFLVVSNLAAGMLLGFAHGQHTKSDELKKIVNSSIMERKKHNKYKIQMPVQEYYYEKPESRRA